MTISDFLKKAANNNYSKDDYYYMLKYLNIKKDTSLDKDIQKYYQEFLESLDNSLIKYRTKRLGLNENTTHYIVFNADKKALYTESVKVYFPVKYEYMNSALKTVFMYLIRNNIQAEVKFHVKATNEGIVIRFYKKSDAKPFIEYCDKNFILHDLLEPLNPFIPSFHGFGIVEDDNTVSSYNKTVAMLLEEYFIYVKKNAFSMISEMDFLDYIIKRGKIEENDIMRFNIKAVEKGIETIISKNN